VFLLLSAHQILAQKIASEITTTNCSVVLPSSLRALLDAQYAEWKVQVLADLSRSARRTLEFKKMQMKKH